MLLIRNSSFPFKYSQLYSSLIYASAENLVLKRYSNEKCYKFISFKNGPSPWFSAEIQGIPAFRDFTIRDPRYFVILFFMILKKKIQKQFFFGIYFFFRFCFFSEFIFSWFLIYSFLFVCRDCHLIAIKIFLLVTKVIRNSICM